VGLKDQLARQLLGMKASFSESAAPGLGRARQPTIIRKRVVEAPTKGPMPGLPEIQEAQELVLQNCATHGKPRELICISCKAMVCHTCALFGEHKGHDVREKVETMREIEVRTEVLMEMFEQMDQQVVTL